MPQQETGYDNKELVSCLPQRLGWIGKRGRAVRVANCCLLGIQLLLLLLLFATPANAQENADLTRLKAVLHAFRDKEGRAPTDVDIWSEALKPGQVVSYQDIFALYEIVRQQQHPTISKEALLNIIKAKRDSIRDFRSTYASRDTHLNDPKRNFSMESKFMMKDNMFFMEKLLKKYDGTFQDTFAYDGENFYKYLPQAKDSGRVATVALMPEQELGVFLDYRMPISIAMLMDSEKFGLTDQNHAHDLVHFLESTSSMVCEKTEMVNGQECVVICDAYMRAWLSPTLDFSPIRLERYSFNDRQVEGMESRIVEKRFVNERREFRDYKDYGNGIWLPSKVNIEYFDLQSGAPSGNNVTTASSIEVNSGLSKESFTDFIPDGTYALDATRNLTYQWGERASVGGLVENVVARKRNSLLLALNVVVCLVLACIVGYRIFRRRRFGGA